MDDRISGIIEALVNADGYELVQNLFEVAIQTYAKHIVDNCVRQNADFHYKSGLSPKIIRTTSGKTCKWCQSLAGVYKYEDVKGTGNDVFRRHANCDCLVVYDPAGGSKNYQNVHDKEWYSDSEYRNRLRQISLKDNHNNDIILSRKDILKRRRIGEQGQEIIDKPTYNKLTKDFLKRGGLIIRGQVAKNHLKIMEAYASYLWNANIAFIRDDATVSDVLEEMYHAFQDRKNMFSEYKDAYERYLRLEIDAQKYLLKVKNRYKIPTDEIDQTKKALLYYQNELVKYLSR